MFFDAVNEVFFTTDRHGVIHSSSPSVEQYGIALENFIGTNISDHLFDPDSYKQKLHISNSFNEPFEYSGLPNAGTLASLIVDIEDADQASIAIISIPEFRNSKGSNVKTHQEVFSSLTSLYIGEWNLKVLTLGEILPGNTIDDTYLAIKEVVTELVKHNIVPVIIGGSQDLTYAIYQSYEKLEQTVNIVDFSPKSDLGNPDDSITSQGWLSKIIMHKPSFLFNYSLIGFQNYLTNPEELNLLQKMYFDTERLGNFYGNEKRIEPLVRNADILTFDLDSIRSSDFNANSLNLPHGFYGEEACRVLRYAGMSDKITVAGLFHESSDELSTVDSNLIAQLIWHFIDGVANRKKDYPIGTKDDYTKYIVSLDEFKDEIIFYKSPVSGRWWMQVPYPKTDKLKFERHLMVPCNYEDYQNALENEMPNLWWKTHQKLI